MQKYEVSSQETMHSWHCNAVLILIGPRVQYNYTNMILLLIVTLDFLLLSVSLIFTTKTELK